MSFHRRDFVKTAGIAIGGAALPGWAHNVHGWSSVFVEVNKNALADTSLQTAKRLGASYSDIRINRYRSESVSTRERQVQNVSRNENFGFGVRVLVNGTWGFSASPLVTVDEVQRVTKEAVDIARANALFQKRRIRLAPTPKVVTTWKSSFEKDPFDVSVDDKITFLMSLNDAALGVKGVSFVNSSVVWVNEQKFLATSAGSR